MNEDNQRLKEQIRSKDDEIISIRREKENLSYKIRDLEYKLEDLKEGYKDQEKTLTSVRDDNEKYRK